MKDERSGFSSLSLCIVFGPPGAGKSSVVSRTVHMISEMNAEGKSDSGMLFQTQVLEFDDHFYMNHEQTTFDSNAWSTVNDAFFNAVSQEVRRRLCPSSDNNGQSVILFVVDVFHLSSMRKRYERMFEEAVAFRCGENRSMAASFMEVLVMAPLATCLTRNATRTMSHRVPDDVVEKLHAAISQENLNCSSSSELVVVDNTGESCDAAGRTLCTSVLALKNKPDVVQRLLDRQRAARLDEKACTSLMHRVDILIRKLVAVELKAGLVDDTASGGDYRKQKAVQCAKAKKSLISRVESDPLFRHSLCGVAGGELLENKVKEAFMHTLLSWDK